jgi:K+-sensing histidine kinase KdpD
MKMFRLTFTPKLYRDSFYAVMLVAAATLLFLLIGFARLGEAVITLLYLVPIVWSAARWGRGPGMSAALAAALAFIFFFRPPFFGFPDGNLNDTLILIIFLFVAGVVVARVQIILSRAQASEREALLMYELSTILAMARTQEAVAYGVARFLRRRYPVPLVTVSIQLKGQTVETAAYEPQNAIMPPGKPDRTLVILDAWGPAGEIHIWSGGVDLPGEDSRLFQDFTSQIGQALERTRLTQIETMMNSMVNDMTAKTK